MTASVTSRAERARQAELRELAALMRERGGLAPLPPPTPLHKMAAAAPERPRTQEAGQSRPMEIPSAGRRMTPRSSWPSAG